MGTLFIAGVPVGFAFAPALSEARLQAVLQSAAAIEMDKVRRKFLTAAL